MKIRLLAFLIVLLTGVASAQSTAGDASAQSLPTDTNSQTLAQSTLEASATTPNTKTPLSRIAFGSCLHQYKVQPIWNAVYAQRPELFVFLGDNIYGDTGDMDLLAQKYETQNNHPDFALLKETCPYIGTWDDHDYGVNDVGVEWPKKQRSKELMLEFFKEPEDSPRWSQNGVYTSYTYGPVGKRVQVILLDTRWFRSPILKRPRAEYIELNRTTGRGPCLINPDPDATLLGDEQWAWLEEQLKEPAEIRLIGTSIPLIQYDTGWETWENFPHELQRFYDLLNSTKANGVILLTGDTHRAEFSRVDDVIGYPLWELNSSGLTENARSRPPNKNRMGEMFVEDNFGLVRVNWQLDDPQISLEIRAADNDLVTQNIIRLSELSTNR